MRQQCGACGAVHDGGNWGPPLSRSACTDDHQGPFTVLGESQKTCDFSTFLILTSVLVLVYSRRCPIRSRNRSWYVPVLFVAPHLDQCFDDDVCPDRLPTEQVPLVDKLRMPLR